MNAIIFVFIFDAFFLLLPLNSDAAYAFYAIIGLSTLGFQLSYGLPILLKLIYPQPNFPLTKMSLGKWSPYMGVIACIWLFGTCTFLFLPLTTPVTETNMNYLVVVATG